MAKNKGIIDIIEVPLTPALSRKFAEVFIAAFERDVRSARGEDVTRVLEEMCGGD